jgi:predicted regulator of Ras-like GTPase activity (Roadblock/LC7/MglB family)
MRIDVDVVVKLLLDTYEEKLMGNGDLIAEEFARGWPEEVEYVRYDADQEKIMFLPVDSRGVLALLMKQGVRFSQ